MEGYDLQEDQSETWKKRFEEKDLECEDLKREIQRLKENHRPYTSNQQLEEEVVRDPRPVQKLQKDYSKLQKSNKMQSQVVESPKFS